MWSFSGVSSSTKPSTGSLFPFRWYLVLPAAACSTWQCGFSRAGGGDVCLCIRGHCQRPGVARGAFTSQGHHGALWSLPCSADVLCFKHLPNLPPTMGFFFLPPEALLTHNGSLVPYWMNLAWQFLLLLQEHFKALQI